MNKTLLILLTSALPVSCMCAEAERAPREAIEWTDVWIADANTNALPKVLLIGDSISKGYFPFVEQGLRGKADVARLSTSAAVGDPVLFETIATLLKHYKFSVIHFNNGLHGWSYTEMDYEKQLPNLVEAIRAQAGSAKLIWATTTPVRSLPDLPDERTERVKARNQIASRVMTRAGIVQNDLYSAVVNHHEYWRGKERIHLTKEGYEVLGHQIVKAVEAALNAK